MYKNQIHIKVWRTWVGPKGRKTQTGPYAFFRPGHHEMCPDKPWLEGPYRPVKNREGKVIRQWYKECHADDYYKV